ncbi:5-formyltetrahydrofolate cyclo-ligase [uncultured Duncaniella sp.]|uniref:5-formyltetrahydrofolate cyclo-ligase n=1 Tax=uncultured Duncaniella sp. TaxID=2768039 RepID=UPI0026477840|nr:5-formyltetrahydrofolate cyclo-ligase [uncultured Duncaniella sp.]
MNKDDIRRRIKARKTMLDAAEKNSAAEKVFSILEKTAAFMLADRILMYHSLPDELSTHKFIDRWASKKHFYLPRVNGVNLDILPYDETRLSLGSFQIEEPTGDDTTDINDIELIIVPAVAYDRQGNRVGRGKGYYDRLLTGSKATKIGVGYDFQLIEEGIETDPHDVRMDVVITESHHIVIRRK